MTPLIESLENARSLKIHFKTDFKEGECLKLVFASDELSRAAEEGDGICFKGTEGKLDAVICTSTKTFRLKKVETSNSVLVVPPTQIRFNGRYEVMAKASYYYETVSLKPIFDGLMAALKQSEYRGYDNERSTPSGDLLLYTERELGEMILCSEEELCRMLKIIGAINIDGYVRLCSPKVLHDLNGTLINTIIEKDWDVNNISWSECVAEMPDVDLVILDYTLSRLGEKNIDGRTWALSHINLARAVAHLIFNETEKVEIQEFMSLWHSRTPGSQILSEELLRGIAMKSEDGSTFVYFPVEMLSRLEKSRFQQLYKYRNKYTLDEIEPYIIDLLSAYGDTGKSRQVGLLLKYTKLVEGFYIPSDALELTN